MTKINIMTDNKFLKTKFADWINDRNIMITGILAGIQTVLYVAFYVTFMIAAWKYILS